MKEKTEKRKIKIARSDRLMYILVNIMLLLIVIIAAYPIIFVISSSFSSGAAVSTGRVLLWPVEPSIQGYRLVFAYRSVWTGFANSLFYMGVGTALNMVLTIMAAYPLSRPNFQGRKIYMTLFLITMVFSAGLIPKYILMVDLGLTNTRWAIILATAVSAYNMIIMRTYFRSNIPGELYEAAYMDGCSEIRCLMSIVLPLSKSILAVITLYYAVAHWNSYFAALLYLRRPELYPLQLILRDILKATNINLAEISDPEVLAMMTGAVDLMKYSLIVVSSAPIIALYPFVQKHFKKGVMIGSVKG